MKVSLWVKSPLLEPNFVLQIGKTGPSYGPKMVHWKSNVMKISYYRWERHLAMVKTSIFPQEKPK